MHAFRLLIVASLTLSTSATAQWVQSDGTQGLNMQSLHSGINGLDFAGGQFGAYRSDQRLGQRRSIHLYVYTCTSQGVFRSGDEGASWIPQSRGLITTLSSGMIAPEGRLFVVGPGGVFGSTNQGNSWESAGLSNVDVRCITSVGSVLFVGTLNSGIYRSDNWGDSWTSVGGGLPSTTFRAIESKGSIVFAGGQNGTGVFRSNELGETWTLLGGSLPTGSYRGFAHDELLIVADGFGSGVHYSLDDGDTWTTINGGLSDLTVFDLELNATHLYVATSNSGVFRFPRSVILPLLGDINGDGAVNGGDLSLLLVA